MTCLPCNYPLWRSQPFNRSKVQRQLSRSEAVLDVPIVIAVPPLRYVQNVKLRSSSFNSSAFNHSTFSRSQPFNGRAVHHERFIEVLAPIRRMNWRQNSQRIDKQQCHSRFFSNDFAVLPNIDRGAVHACGFAGNLCGAAQGAPDGGGEFHGFFFTLVFFMVLVPAFDGRQRSIAVE